MPKTIVVGFDPKSSDRAPVELGRTVARFTGAPVIVVLVEARLPVLAGDEDLVEDCSDQLAAIDGDLAGRETPVECRRVRSTSAARGLQEVAEAESAGLLVIGAPQGRVGTTAQRLLNGAPCPVAVAPHRWAPRGRIETIGVAYVDSDEAREALRSAHTLARHAGATLRVITVVRVTRAMYDETEAYVPPTPGKDLDRVAGEHRVAAEQQLRRVVAELGDDVPIEVDAFVGDPAETLVELSERLGLLVCGSRGYGPLRSVLLGSVSRRVVAEARCPVLVLPRGVRAALESLVAATPGAAAAA